MDTSCVFVYANVYACAGVRECAFVRIAPKRLKPILRKFRADCSFLTLLPASKFFYHQMVNDIMEGNSSSESPPSIHASGPDFAKISD